MKKGSKRTKEVSKLAMSFFFGHFFEEKEFSN
jgi:hypothetical protein